jgi:hypothetical protein
MKTKLVPFDIEKAKNGAKIVTRTGLNVRIGFQDVKNGNNPILGLVSVSDYTETPMFYTKDGRHMEGFVSDYDLFIEEKEVEETDDYNPYKIAIEALANMVKLYYSSADSDELKDFYNEVKAKCREAIEYDKKWCKKQDEQKTKIEPKFKVGDWIVQENAGVYKVTEICDSWYEVIDSHELHYSIGFDQESMCHLWTIQDAKAGDVLHAVGQHNDCIFIFNRLDNDASGCDRVFVTGYCCLDITADKMEFCVQGPDSIEVGAATVKPATKIQCDLLFQKMKEAGYDWFPNIKEIHKIGEVKKRRMTHQELSWWLRDCPEEHREYSFCDDEGVRYFYAYRKDSADKEVEKECRIRRNGGEWEEPLIEE